MKKSLWWIPRHLETMKGVETNEMLREAGNKLRFEDSRIGQPFKLPIKFINRKEIT